MALKKIKGFSLSFYVFFVSYSICRGFLHMTKTGDAELPSIIASLEPEVTGVTIRDNHLLPVLPPDVFSGFPNISEVNIRGTNLSVIHTDAFRGTGIRTLEVTGSRLKSVPDLSNNPFLETVKLSDNNIISIPPDSFSGTPIKVLNLEHNDLPCFPDLGHLNNLDLIDVSGNDIGACAEEAATPNTRLRWVIAKHSGITNLTEVVVLAPKAAFLLLTGNNISSLPSVWPENLISLSVQDNEFRGVLPGDVFPPGLRNLYAADNQFTHIDPNAFRGTIIKVIDLSGNKLTSIPDLDVVRMTLETLSFDENNISSFPVQENMFPMMTDFSAVGNKMTSLPDVVKMAPALETLMLNRNRIQQVPDMRRTHAHLRAMNLRGNALTCTCTNAWLSEVKNSNSNMSIKMEENCTGLGPYKDYKFTDQLNFTVLCGQISSCFYQWSRREDPHREYPGAGQCEGRGMRCGGYTGCVPHLLGTDPGEVVPAHSRLHCLSRAVEKGALAVHHRDSRGRTGDHAGERTGVAGTCVYYTRGLPRASPPEGFPGLDWQYYLLIN